MEAMMGHARRQSRKGSSIRIVPLTIGPRCAVSCLGATLADFFLDHATAIQMTADQQAVLTGMREESIGELATAQRQIDRAEQERLMLTSSDQPDSMSLEMKVREIERLTSDQRIAQFTSVYEAARQLVRCE